MQIYKIRQKSTGLFSAGGLDHKWKKNGKIWKNKQSLGGHLDLLKEYSGKYKYKNSEDVEIVVYNIVEDATIDLNEYKGKSNAKN